MQLEAVTAELRPRSEWEAVDLGLAMVRRDFWALTAAWWMGMAPVILIGLPLLHQHPAWFCLVFWWLTPIASRLALFRLSRRLFGETPSMKAVIRSFPAAVKRRFFYRFIWARFSPWRPLTGAVEDLEGLRGKAYSARCGVLMRRGDSSLSIIALWKVFLTFWLALTIFATAGLFVPESISAQWSEIIQLWFDGDSAVPPIGLSLAMMTSLCLSIFLVDVFSLGAGFGIYLNHRTWVEGWDVEIAFRRLGNRLQQSTARKVTAAILALGIIGFSCLPAKATSDDTWAHAEIERILSHEDFTVHDKTYTSYEPHDWDFDFGGGNLDGSLFAIIVEIIKVLVIGGVIALIAFLLYRYRHVFMRRGSPSSDKPKTPTATVVMGMAVTRDSLPDDVVSAARAAWQAGKHHEALSLLYRGALAWMIAQGGIPIAESDTESDCLRRVDTAKTDHASFFASLTFAWIALAYGNRKPSEPTIDQLFTHWPFHAAPQQKGGQA